MNRSLHLGDPDRFRAVRLLDVLIPTRNRPAELAVTLAGLGANDVPGTATFGVVVSDQSDGDPPWAQPAVAAAVRVLRHKDRPVLLTRHLPRRGLAEQRAFLLDRSAARYVLYLDDDVWLEPGALARMLAAIEELGCGFVGNAVHGLSYLDDVRPETHRHYEEWRTRPIPERLRPGMPEWERAQIHSAANLMHVTAKQRIPDGGWRAYKVSWIGGCVLYDRLKLSAVGGFDFWTRLDPRHQGEDVAAQMRVMDRYGGAGILPSGAYHQEAPTTVPERVMEAWEVLLPDEAAGRSPLTAGDHPPLTAVRSATASSTSTTGTSVTNETRCPQSSPPPRSG